MKFRNPLLVVRDMERSIRFYRETLGLRVTVDFGANVTLTGGICLQTKDSWKTFIHAKEESLIFGGGTAELYFEEDDFDAFLQKLSDLEGIQYVHPVVEHSWGQRAIRFYDPDRHMLEVGENMKTVCRRSLDGGMTAEEAAARMDVPVQYVKACMR